MSPPNTTNEIGALLADLRNEIEKLPRPTTAESGRDLGTLVARMQGGGMITGDGLLLVAPGRLHGLKSAIKKQLRRSLRWYVEPIAVETRHFADASTRVASSLAEATVALEGQLVALEGQLAERTAQIALLDRQVSALRDRLGRAERRGGHAPTPSAVAPAMHDSATVRPAHAASPAGFDYFSFEALMRGSREEIAARQAGYLEHFEGLDDILDAGCGRGEFLVLLRQAGKRARGADMDPDMIDQCRAEGLEVIQDDVINYLSGLDADSLGGVFSAQLVEHLPPPRLLAFLAACARAIRPGGTIILETINPTSLSALRHYFADLTHAQPLVPETLAFLVESAGFRDVRVELASPVADAGRLAHVPFGSAVPAEARAASDRNVDLLNALLFAPQDYAVIAHA